MVQLGQVVIIVQIGKNSADMNKKITEKRIHNELQSISREAIPSVILQSETQLTHHFCFYGLEEDFKEGFYHGVLQLPEDYPFSPPKIKMLTNNGRFEVGKSICTTFTHYHKETWSSSWNIRTILTAMISFMYSNERGIASIHEPPEKRRALAAKSLQQNLKTPKFVQLFREKLISLKLVTAEHIESLMVKPQRIKRRRRERSQTTYTQQIRQIPEIPQTNLRLQAIGEEEGKEDYKNNKAFIDFMDQEATNRKRFIADRDHDPEQLAEFQALLKKRKLEQGEGEVLQQLYRQKTVSGQKV